MAASHPSDSKRFIVEGLYSGSGGRGAAMEGRTAKIGANAGATMRPNPGFLKPSLDPRQADLPRIMPWRASIRLEIPKEAQRHQAADDPVHHP
jgi:hypothetical protein